MKKNTTIRYWDGFDYSGHHAKRDDKWRFVLMIKYIYWVPRTFAGARNGNRETSTKQHQISQFIDKSDVIFLYRRHTIEK